jgi:hypothetical protein
MLVDVLVRCRFTAHILLMGWICTSCGIGLMTFLDANKSVSSDVLLNLLSGLGISILLSALHIKAADIRGSGGGVKSQTFLISLRYLGSTVGLVVVGDIFRHVLRQKLAPTKFGSMAGNMTQRTTALLYSIHDLPDPMDVEILLEATQSSLRSTWLILAVICLAMVLISLLAAMVTSRRTLQARD